MCDSDFDDAPALLVYAWRRARKEHCCFACHEVIPAGHRYHYSAQIYDGFAAFKHCARCWAMCEAILGAGAETVQWDLACGVSWQEAFEEQPPENVQALAFMTPEEAQVQVVQHESDWPNAK